MIIGLILKNYKAYREPVYIPLSNGENFTGIIGENGAGKSSVLESLNTFFNDYPWQCNEISGSATMAGYIVPLFLIRKEEIKNLPNITLITLLSKELWKIKNETGIPDFPAWHAILIPFITQIRQTLHTLPAEYDHENYLIVPAMKEYQKPITAIGEAIRNLYRYFYIPPQYGGWAQPSAPVHARYPFAHLSAGEKAEAFLPLLREWLTTQPERLHYILAFDESEIALQISARYDQFEMIYQLTTLCSQVFTASHWYGFIPMLTNGLLVDIVREPEGHQFLKFDIGRFREEIKIRKRLYREKYHEELPVNVMLKSNNDFIQSLLGGVINDIPYNWLICEGSSEKILFDYYFGDLIANNHLRIVPVGGIREVKKLYTYLAVAFKDLEESIRGKIVLLTDTDAQLLEFETPAIHNLYCYRLINERGETHLVHISANPKSPATEIEDALNGQVFNKTLQYFKPVYPELLNFIQEDSIKPESPSYYAMDLSLSQKENLTAFFDAHHTNKVAFAQKYVEICKSDRYHIPDWIVSLRKIFTTDSQVGDRARL